jgi:hypothetical protein
VRPTGDSGLEQGRLQRQLDTHDHLGGDLQTSTYKGVSTGEQVRQLDTN